MSELPTYSPTRRCAKCGGIATTALSGSDNDRILRRCVRCGWTWHERTLDAKDQPS